MITICLVLELQAKCLSLSTNLRTLFSGRIVKEIRFKLFATYFAIIELCYETSQMNIRDALRDLIPIV